MQSHQSAAVQLCAINICTELADAPCMSPLRCMYYIIRCRVIIYKYAYNG